MENNVPQKSMPLGNYQTLVLLGLVWGSSFILIKKGLIAFSPQQVAAMRISISALAFLPIVLYRFRKIDWSKWKTLLIVGLTGSAIPAFLFSEAQTELSSSIAGILNSLAPLFTLIFGIVIFRVSVEKRKISGVVVGLLGAILMTAVGEQGDWSGNLKYGLLIVIAVACYGLSANVVAHKLKDFNSLDLSAVSFMLVGLPGLFYLLSTDFVEVLHQNDQAIYSLGAILCLSLLGTVLASIIFYSLIQRTSALFGSSVTYLMPIISLAWGLFDGEMITFLHFIGMCLILLGVYLSRN